jgi:hypothetical protein
VRATPASLSVLVRCCVLAITLIATFQDARGQQTTQQDSGSGTSPVFKEIEAALRKKSRVPPRLPSFLPHVDREHPIDAVLETVSSSDYSILLAVEPSCQGQNWCLYGSVQASSSPLKLERNPGVPVSLRHGIGGTFMESVCQVYCNQAYVEWKEHGFYYAIGIKAGRKNQLVRAANSAIP